MSLSQAMRSVLRIFVFPSFSQGYGWEGPMVFSLQEFSSALFLDVQRRIFLFFPLEPLPYKEAREQILDSDLE